MASSGEDQRALQLTNFMELSPSLEATSELAPKEFRKIFMGPRMLIPLYTRARQ